MRRTAWFNCSADSRRPRSRASANNPSISADSSEMRDSSIWRRDVEGALGDIPVDILYRMESISDKIAIVTGGSRGIGRAIAERLLREGAKVAICGRTAASVESAVAAMQGLGPIFGAAADISDAAQVRNFFQAVDRHFGALDILVNNAGQGVFRKVAEMTVEDWHRNIDLN